MVRRSRRRRDESGVSSVELVLYMPLLMLIILIAVQFSLVWFGNQAASAVARETARNARVYDDGRAAQEGYQYAATIGEGVLEDPKITVTPIGDGRVRVTVRGRAQELVPGLAPEVVQTVEGPIEEFQDDEGAS